jgi:hypothetical protein
LRNIAFHGGTVIQLATTVRTFNFNHPNHALRACRICSYMFDALFGGQPC